MATVSGKIYQVKDGTTNLFPRTVIEAVYGLEKTIADVKTWVGNSFVKYSHGIYNPTSAVDLNDQYVAENTIQQISWNFSTYSNVSNRPYSSASAASVLVLPNSWGGLQFYTDYNSNTYYIRNRYSTTGWQSWVQLYHSGNLTQSVITGLIGTTTYAPYKSSGYLPLAAQGETIYRTTSGQIVNFNNSKGANEEAYLVLQSNSTSKAAVGWSTTYGTYIYNYASAKYLGIKDDGTPHYQGNTLYHAGNANLSTVPWTASGFFTPNHGSHLTVGPSTWTYRTVLSSSWSKETGDYLDIGVPSNGNGSPSVIRLLGNGNVGIGFTNPQYKLDVNGTVGANSFQKVGGTSAQFLKADGSIDSTAYLPLAGGTMANTNVVTNLNADLLDGLEGYRYARNYSYTLEAQSSVVITFTNMYACIISARWTTGFHPLFLIGSGYGDTDARNKFYQLSKKSSNVGWRYISGEGIEITNMTTTGNPLYIVVTMLHSQGVTVTFTAGTYDATSAFANVANAFVDSNVASATKLETTRTIWGQNFNGTANVSGNLTIGTSAIIYNTTHTSDWTNPQNAGLRILNTVGTSATGAPNNYAVALSVSGYYGFQLACTGANNNFYIRSTSNGAASDHKAWVQLWHSANSNLSTVSWTCSTLTAYGVIEAKHAIYANRYNGQGNVAGASIVINKGGDYFGIGPSSTNVADLAFGTTSNNTGTWKSIWGYFSASVCSYTGVANVGGLKVTGSTKVTDGDGFEVYWDATNKRSVINSYGRGTGGSYYPMLFGASYHYFNSGNVGIYKNNPTYPLDVVGVIHSTVGIFSDGYVSALGTASSSDAKLKDDITTISYDRAKEVLSALNPREWTWNSLTSKEGERGAGMVAQEVESILPDTVKEIGGNLTLEYNTLFAYGLAMTKYLVPAVESLEERVARLERENEELKRQLTN